MNRSQNNQYLQITLLLIIVIFSVLSVKAESKIKDDTIKVKILEDFEVVGYRNQSIALSSKYIGAVSIPYLSIVRTPVVLGESDVIKTLQMEPGVSSGVEGFAGLYVHGGDSDENQYSISNVPLYQVGHLGGLFSAFNTHTIKSVDFYKTTFPSRYDGRLSSYVDILTRDGDANHYHGSFTLGVTAGSLYLEGPIYKERTSFSLGIRKSWIDLLLRPALNYYNNRILSSNSNYFDYGFVDMNCKIVHRFNSQSRVYVETYFGNDRIAVSHGDEAKDSKQEIENHVQANLSWGNLMVATGWEHEYDKSFQQRVSLSYLKYGSYLTHESDKKVIEYTMSGVGGSKQVRTSNINNIVKTDNSIKDICLSTDFVRKSDRSTMRFGFSGIMRHFLPYTEKREKYESLKIEEKDSVLFDGALSVARTDSTEAKNGIETHLYLENELQLSKKLLINLGINLSGFVLNKHKTGAISPRFSLNYRPYEVLSLKCGYSRTAQYVHQLTQSLLSLPTDQWLPINETQKPVTADKIALGGYGSVSDGMTFSVEAYMKWMHNLIDYVDEVYLLPPFQQTKDATAVGSGRAKGVDFKLTREVGKLTGHLAYSLLWADRLFAAKNYGKRFPSRFDNRHKINLFLMYNMSKTWEFSTTWTGISGNMISLPFQSTDIPGGTGEIKESINNYRLPFYHRMDLSITGHFEIGDLNLGIYNVYNKMNVVGIIKSGTIQDQKYKKITLFPIIPSLSYTYNF